MIIFLLALCYASTLPAADLIELQAGPLSMVFDPDTALLRYLKVGSHEVLHGINAPIRDQYWGTVPPQVKIVDLTQQPDQFELKFEVTCRQREVAFLWHGTIEGHPDGTVEYTFDGEALNDFKRNRIGFCVLHGESVAGRPWELETTTGEKLKGEFPSAIAPHQPAKNLRSVTHEYAPGAWARVQFSGDIFEMEDQRNWTDASFKTYCTPLKIPYPVQLSQGDKVQQKITVSLHGTVPEQTTPETVPVKLSIQKTTHKLPGIGLQLSSESNQLTEAEIQHLRTLHLDHLRVDLTPEEANFSSRWSQAARQANAINTSLIAALHLGNDPEADLQRVVAECRSVAAPVTVWLVISADHETFEKVRSAIHPHYPDAWIGLGEDTNFTELNRNRPDLTDVDVVSYGLNPQVHAFDNTSMVETLPIQAETVRTARQFVGDMPLIISPVSLRVQKLSFSSSNDELPANVDPRQPSQFAAAWTLGSLKYLSDANVNRITYFETVGRKGVMVANRPDTEKTKFPDQPNDTYPIFDVLQIVGEFSGGEVRQISSTDSSRVVALALKAKDRSQIIVANLTQQSQSVLFEGIKVGSITFTSTAGNLGATNHITNELNRGQPITIPPYALVTIDYQSDQL